MQSNGGLTTDTAAIERPMNIIESGPAGGVVGAQALARTMKLDKIITFDMGGTTAKASMVEHGEVMRAHEYAVGAGIMIGSRLLTGAGYTLKVPAIDLAEVGAGGGSHIWIDAGGALQVGPESAGAVPGPVCYDAGGEVATITDANVILGYLNPAASDRRRPEAQRGEGAAGVRGQDRRAAGPRHRGCGLRRAPDRRLQHDPRHQGGVDRAGPRSARVRAVRLRRQRPAVCLRHGQLARDRPGDRAAGAGPVLVLRAALCRRRASLLAHLPPPAAGREPRRDRRRLGRPVAAGDGPARDRGLHGQGCAPAPLRGDALSGAELRAHRAGAGRAVRRRHGGAPGGGLRARARDAPTATAPGRRSRSSWSRSR